MAVVGGADFAQVLAINAVDLRAGETPNFHPIVGEKRISSAVPKKDTVPSPQPIGRAQFCSNGLRAVGGHTLPEIGRVGKP